MNELLIFQNNINGFYSKAQLLEQNLNALQPHICLLQECFRSERRQTSNQQFQNLYNQFCSETGRTGILCRRYIRAVQKFFIIQRDKFHIFGYESCWIEINFPGQSKSILFCSFYRNIQKLHARYKDGNNQVPKIVCFDLDMFETEIIAARKIS